MKHLSTNETDLAQRLITEAKVSVSETALSIMLRHVDWLIEAGKTLNLTAITAAEAAVRLHLVDSLLALPEVAGAPEGLLVDLGTGGGFPGLELSLATGRDAVLIDSVKKKVDALDGFLVQESLEARVSVSALRAEEMGRLRRGEAAVVTARALASLPSLVELASPLLKNGGRLVALKARPDDDELRRGREAAGICGMQERSIRRIVLPGGDEMRTIVTYERVGSPATALPRRMGLAQKHPLA